MIPEWLEPHIQGIYAQGYTKRIIHPYQRNGEVCSEGKTGASAEACQIYRKTDGWYVYCFRCGYNTYFKDGWGSPDEVRRKLERIKNEPQYDSLAYVQLPEDFMPMQSVDSPVPIKAWEWLWSAGIMDEEVAKYNIGWSPAYDRVIIPCNLYAILSPSGHYAEKLAGWIGREVKYGSKEERNKAGCVKYLTKKSDAIKHLMFVAPGDEDRVVLVEDALSAIRINNATGYTAIALLTTHIPRRLMRDLRGKQVTIWLDADVLAKAVGYATQMNNLGVVTKYCGTPRDPKGYSDEDIRGALGCTK